MDIKEIALRIGEEADDYADVKLQSKGEFHPDWHTVRDEYFAEALISAYKAELLKEVGEPTCRVSTTGIITNQTNAPLEPGLELYTADQLIAARKGLEEGIERLSERRCEICGYAEHHREHTSCLRTQLAAAQEEWNQCSGLLDDAHRSIEMLEDQLATAEQRVAEACALACEDVIGNTANDQRMIAAIDCSAMIRSGEWRKFVKEV